MAQLSISIDSDTESRLEHEVRTGDFQSKSELVKKALHAYMADLAYERILKGQREYKEGKSIKLKGSLLDHIRTTKV